MTTAQQPDAPALRSRSLSKPMAAVRPLCMPCAMYVDLDVRAGDCRVLPGESDSGKSTLLNILGGVDRPSTGEVTFLDHCLTVGRP